MITTKASIVGSFFTIQKFLFLCGRFASTVFMRYFKPGVLLALFGVGATLATLGFDIEALENKFVENLKEAFNED